MSEEKKESEVEAKPTEVSSSDKADEEAKAAEEASVKAETAAKAVEDAENAVKEALAKADAAKAPDYTFKRQGEEIFRREMGEPEFWLEKEDRFPRPILTADQQESLTRQAEIPQDQTPEYNPQHVLSPEFGGVSNYERGVGSFLVEAKQNLENLKNNPEATEKDIKDAEDKIIYLESLHENYFIGMNVFRTAKGGREKIKA